MLCGVCVLWCQVDRENSGLSLVESLIAYAQSIAPQQLARPVKVRGPWSAKLPPCIWASD